MNLIPKLPKITTSQNVGKHTSPNIWRAYVCHKITRKTDKELYQDGRDFKHRVRVGKKQIRCAYYCRACAFPPCGSCGKVLANALPIDEAQRTSKAGESSYQLSTLPRALKKIPQNNCWKMPKVNDCFWIVLSINVWEYAGTIGNGHRIEHTKYDGNT